MVPHIFMAVVASLVVTPGDVPVVADVHPDETVWIQELKDARPEPMVVRLPAEHIVRVRTLPANIIPPDDLRLLVEAHFLPEDVDRALLVAWCESRWDASAQNPTSSAAGLFQHLRGWYSGEWGVTGVFNPYVPEESVAAAAALVYGTSSGWGNWYPSEFCWG